MARKIRKDITVKGLEKKLNIAPGTIKNPNGRDARSDKKLETLQKEFAKAKISSTKKPASISAIIKKVSKPQTADQKTASFRTVKSNPKATISMVRKVSAAIKKTSKK